MATPKNWVKIALFLSSYFPLWIIFLVSVVFNNLADLTTFDQSPDWQTVLLEYVSRNASVLSLMSIFLIVAFLPLSILRRLLKETLEGTNPEKITVKNKEELTSEYMLYIITYVFPFLTGNLLESSTAIPLIGIMVTIGILYVRANLFHVNPTLMLFSYRLFKITDQHISYYLLSKREEVFDNLTIRAYSMSGLIYIEKPYVPADNSRADSSAALGE